MEIVRKQTLQSGPKYDLARHTLRTPTGEEFTRDFFDHPGAALMLPVLRDGRIVLIRNFRHALDQFILELPAGTLGRGEPYADAARRELQEETGYRAGRIEELLDFLPSPGLSTERMKLFLCTELTPGECRRESDEEMSVEVFDPERVLAMSRDGTIKDGKTMLGLWHWDWLRRNGSNTPPAESPK